MRASVCRREHRHILFLFESLIHLFDIRSLLYLSLADRLRSRIPRVACTYQPRRIRLSLALRLNNADIFHHYDQRRDGPE